MSAWSDRKRRSMSMKLGSVLCLVGLLLSACGSVAIPTDIPIPTDLPGIELPTFNPPIIETIVATSPPATSAGGGPTSTPGVSIPVTGDGSNGTTMWLYGLLALFGVIVLFGLYLVLGRPDRPPRDPDDTSGN